MVLSGRFAIRPVRLPWNNKIYRAIGWVYLAKTQNCLHEPNNRPNVEAWAHPVKIYSESSQSYLLGIDGRV